MHSCFKFLIVSLLLTFGPLSHAQDLTPQIKAYLVNFEGEPGFAPLVRGLAHEFERLQHNRKKDPEYVWAVAVAIEPSGRYAVGYGKNTAAGAHPSRNAKRFCNDQRKIRSMKAKCRTFAVNDRIHKPYRR